MGSYSIQMTSYLSGVSPDCIRAWERRYSAISPSRDNGRRVFHDSDVLRLQMLRELSAVGNPISKVAKMSDQELAGMCEAFGIKIQNRSTPTEPPREDSAKTIEMLMMALDSGRIDIFTHELGKSSCSEEMITQVLAKLRVMSGAGKLTPADHLKLLESVASIMARAVAR